MRDDEIQDKFEKHGKITSMRVIRDPFTKECRGYGFITMESSKEADSAIEGLNKTEIDGRQVNVEISKRSRPHQSTPGVYLGTSSSSTRRYRRYSPRRRYRSRSRSRSRSRDRYYKKHKYLIIKLVIIPDQDPVHSEEGENFNNYLLNLIKQRLI